MTPTSSRNESYGVPIDTANAFGLIDNSTDFSHVLDQSLDDYHLSGINIAIMFRK